MNTIYKVKYSWYVSGELMALNPATAWVRADNIEDALVVAQEEIPKRHDIQELTIDILSISEVGDLLN